MIDNINQRISDYLLGRATATERQELEQWLAEDASHRAFFDEIAHRRDLTTAYRTYTSIDKGRAWKRFSDSELRQPQDGRRWLRYAAAIAVIVVAGAFTWWYADYHRVTPPVVVAEVQQAMQENRTQGSAGVTTSSVNLGGNSADATEAAYALSSDVAEELEASQQVATNHERDYWMTLPDGTIVHLNYNSTLIYPTAFGGDRRDVILDGEAYFLVAKDRSRRFYVHTTQGVVCDYGTEFGVNTREHDNSLAVVLVMGKVGVSPKEGAETVLQPGQQAVIKAGNLTVGAGDTEIYRFWNLNHVEFTEWSLQRVLKVLAKWHSCELEVANTAAAGARVSGTIYRSSDITSTLKSLETVSGATLSLENQCITIK